MAKRGQSLRGTFAKIAVSFAALALVVAGMLVVLTTYLHRVNDEIAASVESVRVAEQAEIDLLLIARAEDALVRGQLEADLRHKLVEARSYLTSDQEAEVLAQAESAVEAYLGASRASGPRGDQVAGLQESAFISLEELVTVNLAYSRDAQERSARWNRIAIAFGMGSATALVFVVGWVTWWLRARAFQPVFALARTMEDFGLGHRAVRAEVKGSIEHREIARRFNEMASALSAQRDAVLAFVGGVAHDLRNPLGVLKLSVSSIRPAEPLPPEERLRRILDLIARQITRLERMIEDFLDMARIEAGKLELRLETRDARLLAGEVVDLFEGVSPRHQLSLSVPERVVPVRCDGLRIEQVITNLVSNAIKYSPEGGPVEVSVELRENDVALRVTDHGIGLADADQRRLFAPFRRVGLSKESVPGVGLGLFVVRRIAEEHGGRIEVESAPGLGSTFTVLLPLVTGSEQALPLTSRDQPPTH